LQTLTRFFYFFIFYYFLLGVRENYTETYTCQGTKKKKKTVPNCKQHFWHGQDKDNISYVYDVTLSAERYCG